MNNYAYHVLKLLRPRQWIKNFALFAAPAFGGQIFSGPIFTQVLLGFISFCLLASAAYIVNDLLDVSRFESGKMTYHFQDFNLCELIKKSCLA